MIQSTLGRRYDHYGRGITRHSNIEPRRDVAGAVRARPEFGHRAQIQLHGWGQPIEPNQEEVVVAMLNNSRRDGFHHPAIYPTPGRRVPHVTRPTPALR